MSKQVLALFALFLSAAGAVVVQGVVNVYELFAFHPSQIKKTPFNVNVLIKRHLHRILSDIRWKGVKAGKS